MTTAGNTWLPLISSWNAANRAWPAACGQSARSTSNGRFSTPALLTTNECASIFFPLDPETSTPNVMPGDVVLESNRRDGLPVGPARVVFTLPASSPAREYRITGAVWDARLGEAGSRPQVWTLLAGDDVLAGGTLDETRPRSRPQAFDVPRNLKPGDRVEFVVQPSTPSGAESFVGVRFGVRAAGAPADVADARKRPAAEPKPAGRPAGLLLCDGPKGGNCGVWVFTGRLGEGRWQNGALANLRVERFESAVDGVVIERLDVPMSVSAGAVAHYVGTLRGSRIDGTAEYRSSPSSPPIRGRFTALIPRASCDGSWSPEQAVEIGIQAAGIGQNQTGLPCFLFAAERGSVLGQTLAGQMLREGLGGGPDFAKSLSLLQASASKDDPAGEIALADTYERGYGTMVDHTAAREWRQRAHAQQQAQLLRIIPQLPEIERRQAARQQLVGGFGIFLLKAFVASTMTCFLAGGFIPAACL